VAQKEEYTPMNSFGVGLFSMLSRGNTLGGKVQVIPIFQIVYLLAS
jgi:hypothetical protein